MNRIEKAILWLAALMTAFASAQLLSFFNADDAASATSLALKSLREPTSLLDMYNAVSVFKLLEASDVSCNCKVLESLMLKVSGGYDMFHAVELNNSCNCGSQVPRAWQHAAETSLEADDIYSITGGVLAMKSLGSLELKHITQAIVKTFRLMGPDGRFKSTSNAEDFSIANLHFVLEMFTAIGTSHDQDSRDLISEILEKSFQWIPSGDGNTEADATLIVPLSALAGKKLRLGGKRLVTIAEILLSLKYSNDLAVLYKVHQALQIVSTYNACPLHVSMDTQVLHYKDSSTHRIMPAVKNIFGNPVNVTSIQVDAVNHINTDKQIISAQQLVNNILDLSTAKLSKGSYVVTLSINVAGRPKPVVHRSYFNVVDNIALSGVRMGIAQTKKSATMEVVAVQNSFKGKNIANSSTLDSIHIEFSVTPFHQGKLTIQPHQSVVRFVHEHSGATVVYTGQRVAGDGLNYVVTVPLGADAESFNNKSGRYMVSILIGDCSYDAPVEWVIGSVDLQFSIKEDVPFPLYVQSLLHESDYTLKPLPDIQHTMRPPAERATDTMASIFIVLTLIPLLGFVTFMLYLKPNFARLPSASSLTLLVLLAAILGLYVLYWFSINGFSFYQTIKYLCVLSPATAIVGSYALKSITVSRASKANIKPKQS